MTDILGLSLSETLRWFAIAWGASSTVLVAALLLLRRNAWGLPPGVTITPLTPRLFFLQIVSGAVLMVGLMLLLWLVFGVQRGIALIFAGVVGGQLNMLLRLVWGAMRRR